AFGMPENQAGAGFILNAEEIEFLAEFAMVAPLGLFEFVQIFVEFLLLDETRAVNPLHLRIFFVAFPVGAGYIHQFKSFYAPGGRDVRTAAEVDKFSGGVKGNHRLDGFFFHQFALKFLLRFAIEVERLGLRNQFALVGNIFRGQLVHLALDFCEVLGSERLLAHKFVKESGVNRRADAEFYIRVKFENGRSEQMSSRVAEYLNRVRVLGGEDRQFRVMFQRPREIDQVAVDARDESFLRQARRDLAGNLRGGGALRHLARRSIRQRDLNVIHI